MFQASIHVANEDILRGAGVGRTEKSSSGFTWTVINLDGSKNWLPENMAFDNNDVKSINSPLIILSLSRAGTAGSDTGGNCVVVSCGLLAAVKKFSVVLVCWLLVAPIDGEGGVLVVAIGGKGGLLEASDKRSADSSFGVGT